MEERWTLSYQHKAQRLLIVAEGFATESGCRKAAREFAELIGDKQLDVVVDLNKMTGYSTGARVAWQQGFYPFRKQMRELSIVARQLSAIIRMGATVVGAFIGVPVRFYASMEDLGQRRGVA